MQEPQDEEVKTHTEVDATFLAFAEPPRSATPGQVAHDCVEQGFTKIGIPGPHQPNDRIDFGAIDRQSCIDLANSIELCGAAKGFRVPALSGSFVLMHEQGAVITFANFVNAIAKLMKPKK